MDTTTEHAILRLIADTWRSLRSDVWAGGHADSPWPYGVWICLHDPLPDDASEVTTPLRKAWFLDAEGLRAQNPWSYARFWEMQIRQSWASSLVPPTDPTRTSPRNRIGTAAFAAFAGTDEIYLVMMWGSLWGRAQRVAVRDGQVMILGDLWIA